MPFPVVTIDNKNYRKYEDGVGVEIGGIYNIPVKANFYFEPGLKFYFNAYPYVNTKGEETVRKFGARIPLMFGYHFDFKQNMNVSVFTGPELEFGIWAESHRSHVPGAEVNLYKDNNGLKQFDLLWTIGAGYTYRHFFIGLSGSFGLLNMEKSYGTEFHEHRMTMYLGYNF